MEIKEDVSNLNLAKSFKFPKSDNADFGIANLIEAAELLRRNKIETNQSFSETFFSAAKQYLG